MGVHVLGAASGDPCFFRRAQLNLERSNDLLCELVLHGEDIREIGIKALAPDVSAARSIDKLTGNAHPVACLAHAAFQHVAHAEVTPNLLHVDRLALVGKARIARDNMQLRQFRKIGNDVLADTVGKILLLRISTHVVEGEDGNGGFVRLPRKAALRTQSRPFAQDRADERTPAARCS